ncbi:antitoxin Xre/MbcA/ParS toxin-binding domain-containing protein [Longimicrobium sp.]|uniref:antitoxin Xre/MbcA/ParS toxin-binding domain-containing protein n=1 Tax=Longimicrobium sp. TaxID=2029185 RepID=UPI002E32A603|nr:antitoxin Xre/MbcA/ParS toxin-binding domain-containing protein [Longimicrobium sp.]HEX6040323.1 antitoxin Xre/MbcA/ParS toxin-binding domain-containing protein [Longimicrobium sp.]
MPITTEAPQGFEIFPGSGTTAAVVGENDVVTQRLAGVLNRHRYQVVHHRSPEELLQGLPEPRETPARGPRRRRAAVPRAKVAGGQRPALYVFNCGIPGSGHDLPAGADWIEALKAVSRRAPGTAILVVVRPGQAPGLITDVIRAGADEILSAGDAEIDELVWLRVQSALARAEVAPGGSASSAPWDGSERRQGDRRGGAQSSDVVETWEAPASEDELRAARERVRAVVGHLPGARERQGPLADLLGVSAAALRGDSGRLDARRIAAQLGVPLAQLARITPISRQALHLTPDSARAQAALDPVARVLHVLATVLPPEQARGWLHAPHARLDGETPLHAMLDGRAEQVARMVEAARDGGVG